MAEKEIKSLIFLFFLNSHSFSNVSSCHCQNLMDFCLKTNLDADLNSISRGKISFPVLIGH